MDSRHHHLVSHHRSMVVEAASQRLGDWRHDESEEGHDGESIQRLLRSPNRHQPKPRMSPGWPERGRKDRPVMLSAAKHLAAPRARPFAALKVTIGGNSQTLRCAQGDIVS